MALTVKEYEELMADAEAKLERLRGTYEQYFQGLERIEPNIQKKKVERLFFQLVQEKPRGSTLRFRANQLIQKWSTYQMYWRRVCRQIEEGTFRRHVERAKKHKERIEKERKGRGSLRTGSAPKEGPRAMELDMDLNIELDMNEFAAELTRDPEPLPASAGDDLPFVTERPAARPEHEEEATAARAAAVAAITSSAKTPYKPPAPKLPPGLGAKPAVPAPKLAAAPPAAAASPAPPAPVRPPPPGVTSLAAPPKKPAPPPPPSPGVMSRKPPAPPPPARAAASPAPKAAPAAALGDADVRRVYERYVEARKNNNERVDNVKFEKVKDQIAKMLPDLEKKHQGKKIDFDVVVKDGKVGIKPVAK